MGWVPNLIHIDNDGGYSGVLGVYLEVLTDLATYERLEEEASTARNYQRASALKRQANNIRRRTFWFFGLAECAAEIWISRRCRGVAPEAIHDVAQELELQRDLKIAISEYAPGERS